MDDAQEVKVNEDVVLSKFEGEPKPENEFERIRVVDGTVVEHNRIENSEIVGAVEDSELLGKFIGKLTEPDKEVE